MVPWSQMNKSFYLSFDRAVRFVTALFTNDKMYDKVYI